MSSAYQKPYTIPPGFPELLKKFAREILRTQPDNIYEFGAKYFEELKAQGADDAARAGDQGGAADGDLAAEIKEAAASLPLESMTTAELEPIIMKLFLSADQDGSGYLDRLELKHVLTSADLNLSERQIREVLSEADENDDGVIDYREFVPLMVDLLQGMRAASTAQELMEKAESVVRGAVEDLLVHGMSQAELEALMMRIFRKADTDKSGALSRKEFRECLKQAKLGLTRKEINLIMFQVDTNHDAQITYDEFAPVCFQVLLERFKDEIVANDVQHSPDKLQAMLLQALQAMDVDGGGQLSVSQVKSVLQELSYQKLGLSALQLVTLVSQAPTTPGGMINYIPFVPLAAAMIYKMYDVDTVKLRIQAVKELAQSGGIAQMAGLNLDAMRTAMVELFQEADVDGTGVLTVEDVTAVLERLGAQTEMSDEHVRTMFAAIDVNANGVVDWAELVSFVCDAIEHLERARYVASATGAGDEMMMI